MNKQPTIFQLTKDQKQFVIASANDGIWFDSNTKKEVDLDLLY